MDTDRLLGIVRRTLVYIILIAFAALAILPMYYMFAVSLMDQAQAAIHPPKWFPWPMHPENYARAWNVNPHKGITFGTWYANSFKIAFIDTAGTLLFCSLAAFAFARLRFPGKNIAFGVLLSTMMMPFIVRVIPLYVMFKNIGWIDTHTPLIIPPMLSGVFGVFLLRQFFMTLPMELDEAARIDGCSSLRIWATLILPLSKPALATLSLFTFRTSWNGFLPALIFLNSEAKQTITVGLTLFRGEFAVQWELLFAGSSIAVIPMLIFFLLAQRYFVQSISLTGIKG